MKYEKPIMTISVFGSEYIRQETIGKVPLQSLDPVTTNLGNAIIDANKNIMSSGQIQKALVVIQFNTGAQ